MPDPKLDWVWAVFARTLTAAMDFVLWIFGGPKK